MRKRVTISRTPDGHLQVEWEASVDGKRWSPGRRGIVLRCSEPHLTDLTLPTVVANSTNRAIWLRGSEDL